MTPPQQTTTPPSPRLDGPTPGPWEWRQGGYLIPAAHRSRALGFSIYDKENRDRYATVIATPGNWGGANAAERAANPRLIAAAPDLLEALVEILGPLNICSDNPHVRDDAMLPIDMTMGELRKARAAITRARGKDHA